MYFPGKATAVAAGRSSYCSVTRKGGRVDFNVARGAAASDIADCACAVGPEVL